MALHKVAVAAKDGAGAAIVGGIQQHETSGTGVGPNLPMIVPVDSTGTEIVPGTAANQATIIADLVSILTKLNASIAVTGTFFQATQPVSASALPLPALAATSTKQSDGTQKTQITDGTNTAAVKAASTAALATDPAMVVTMSPNGLNKNLEVAGTTGVAVNQGSPVVPLDLYSEFEPAPVSATTVMGATGAIGNYLATLTITPLSLSPGAVSVKDGTGTAIQLFAGGTSSVGDLKPFQVMLGWYSKIGGWSLITGANVTAVGTGDFT